MDLKTEDLVGWSSEKPLRCVDVAIKVDQADLEVLVAL